MSEVRDVGRPSKFTPERRAAIIDSISHRIPYEIAAEANGICEETLYDWLRTGRAHQKAGIESEFAQFSEAIKRTEQNKIREHLDTIKDKPERWQADAWILERRWWKHFSPNSSVVEFNKRLDQLENQNGGQMDQGGNQASGGVTPGTSCAGGQEDSSQENGQSSEIKES